MRKKQCFVVAANWKMFKSPLESEKFLNEFMSFQKDFSNKVQNLFFVPAMNLAAVATILKGTPILWGAQNIHYESEGAFTGENSPKVLKEMGAQICLIGHSERRTLFFETDELCAKKVKAAQGLGLAPMICVGESLSERKSGKTFQIITEQLRNSLKLFDPKKKFYLAYEPVWAIGTGQVATSKEAQEAHLILRNELKDIMGEQGADATPILYGGSVKPENAQELSDQDQIDGFLIGGASLKIESLVQIAKVKI